MSEVNWEITIKPAEEAGKVAVFMSANLPPRSIRVDLIMPVEDLDPFLEKAAQGVKEVLSLTKKGEVEG